jgi:hypothetical protein
MTDLANAAVTIATKAAGQYLKTHDLVADPATLDACLRSWCKIKIGEAIADAKAAIECNMPQVAESTFAATMSLAGIEAAKEAGFPKS